MDWTTSSCPIPSIERVEKLKLSVSHARVALSKSCVIQTQKGRLCDGFLERLGVWSARACILRPPCAHPASVDRDMSPVRCVSRVEELGMDVLSPG